MIEGFCTQQGDIGIGDNHGALEIFQPSHRTLHRMSGAKLFFLHGGGQLCAELVGKRVDGRCYLLTLMADDHYDIVWL